MHDDASARDCPRIPTDRFIGPNDGTPRPRRTYRLMEFRLRGEPFIETFDAPDDDAALQRVVAVLFETPFELWCGRRLVSRRLRP